MANAQDVYKSLINADALPQIQTEKPTAKADDVLSAILLETNVDDLTIANTETEQLAKVKVSKVAKKINRPSSLMRKLDTDYYKLMSEGGKGVVIQIAGFSNELLWQKFLASYPQQVFFSYQKKVDNSVLTVVTSKVYPNRTAAKEAMQALPEIIIQQQLWLKPISTVIAEINTFKE
jgi:DamX protein